MAATELPDIFISYARPDSPLVKKLAEALRQERYVVWSDKDIQSGTAWRDHIHDKIAKARCVLLVWSQHAGKSWWVAYEAIRAMQMQKLVVVTFDDPKSVPSSFLAETQVIPLRNGLLKPFNRLPSWAVLKRDLGERLKRWPQLKFAGWLGGGAIHQGRVTSVEFHPFEQDALISTGADGKAYLWRPLDAVKTPLLETDENGAEVPRKGVPPTGDVVSFSVGADAAGRPWGINRGAYSADGQGIVLASEAGVAHLFRGRGFAIKADDLEHLKQVAPSYATGQRLHGGNQFSQGIADAAIAANGCGLAERQRGLGD